MLNILTVHIRGSCTVAEHVQQTTEQTKSLLRAGERIRRHNSPNARLCRRAVGYDRQFSLMWFASRREHNDDECPSSAAQLERIDDVDRLCGSDCP